MLVLLNMKAFLPLLVVCCLSPFLASAAQPPPTVSTAETLQNTPLSIPGPEVPKFTVDPATVQRAELKEKLARIHLPKVVLKELPLYEAAAALEKLGIEYDKPRPQNDPGVPILMGESGSCPVGTDGNEESAAPFSTIPGLTPLPVPSDRNPVVSYSAENVSLAEAVEGLARVGRRHVYIATNAVYLTKKEHPPALITRTYLLPPSMTAQIYEQEKIPRTEKERQEATENYFRSLREDEKKDPDHISQSVLDRRTSKLTVTDTESRHQAVAERVEKGWRDYYASDEWKKQKR